MNALIDPRLSGAVSSRSWTAPGLDTANMGSAYSMPLAQGRMQPPQIIDESGAHPLPLVPFADGRDQPMNMLAPYNRDAWNAMAVQQRFNEEMAARQWLQLFREFQRSKQ